MADAGRVIAGSARGIRLVGPGSGTRPLGDRAKQTLFAIVEPEIAGARVLDLFAGSGAAGIEALSRGAAGVVFVERSRAACRTIDENLRRAHLADGRATIVCDDVDRFLAARAAPSGASVERVAVVIADPPYLDEPARLATLERLGAPDGEWLADGAWVVVSHDRHHEPPDVLGLLASERRKRFGETMLTFYRRRVGQGGG
jgi:16S rRNA (guanine(966)-N(2))-methyltransferase RsmD